MSAEMLVGLLLEMATGSSRTPKGGLAAVAKASAKGKAVPSSSGKFGEGAYKDEPWGIVAMRKRIYGARAFYTSVFHGVEGAREKNPAWNDMVTSTLNMLAQLLGTKAQHVPKALKNEQIASLVGACDPKNPLADYRLRGVERANDLFLLSTACSRAYSY